MKKEKIVSKIHISRFVFIFGLFFFLVIIGRLIYLNLSDNIDGINLQEFAKNRNTTKQTLYATRGSIYDKNGETLAQTIDSYTVIAYLDKSRSKNSKKPLHVVDKRKTAQKLSPILNMTEENIFNLLDQKGLYQVELGPGGKGLTELQKEQIEKLKLPGIDFISSTKRYYPNLDFASYTLGYVKTSEDGKMVGEMGIEAKYNEELTGTNGSLEYQKDANGYKLINSPEIKIDKLDGVNIYLTLDSNIQLMAERALNKAFEDSKAKSALLVVAEAKTGKIVASTSKPSFDPNIKNIQSYLDPLLSVAFEPGSTMKTYTYMTTIEKGNYNGEDKYMSGTMDLSGYRIKDWNNYGWGEITYDYGYMQSSNIGVANLMQKYITKEELFSMYKKLGFGSKTGIELPNETTGEISFKYDIEVANASFGQGIKTTPIQHIKALTSISNDGYLLNPTIVDKIVDSNTGEILYQSKKQKGTKLIKKTTVDKLKELMNSVVNNPEGTGAGYHLDGYDIIGKTGTAQVYNEKTGSYYPSAVASIKSFEGMYPKDNPKYIFYIAVENAQGNPMQETIKSLVQDIETYYNLSNNGTSSNNIYKMDNFINKKIDFTKGRLDANSITYEVIGDGDKIINQYPSSGKLVNGKVILVTNNNNRVIPNITGYSSKEVTILCDMLNIPLEKTGNGYVASYNVEMNEDGSILKVSVILDQKYKDVLEAANENSQ